MSVVSKAELMEYCRVDEGDPLETQLEPLAETAEEYLTGAGVVYSAQNAARYCLAVKALTNHWLDNPTGGELPPALTGLVTQIKKITI